MRYVLAWSCMGFGLLQACTTVSGTSPDAGTLADASGDTTAAPADASQMPDTSVAPDASTADGSVDGSTACVGAFVANAVEDTGAIVAQGSPEVKSCTDPSIAVSAGKYVAGRAYVKFDLSASAASKLAAGTVQNVRVHLTLKTSTANAGQAPCLVGPPGNEINNCMFAFQACPLTSAWTEAPTATCASYTHQDPAGNVEWPAGTFNATCGTSATKDFANGAVHAGDIDIPIAAALLGPAVSGTKVSVYLPPLAPNSGYTFYSHEEPDASKRPKLLFDCNP